MAVNSKTDAVTKIRYLRESGADSEYKTDQGYSILHIAAKSATATVDVLQACREHLNLRPNLTDSKNNTPLHIAAMSKHQGSDMLLHSLAAMTPSEHLNVLNDRNESPLRLVLRDRNSDKELRRSKVRYLLKQGYQPTRRDFNEYKGDSEDFKSLFLVDDVILRSNNPIQLLLFLGRYCKRRYDNKETQNTDRKLTKSAPLQAQSSTAQVSDWIEASRWRDLNAKFEVKAVAMIGELGKRQEILGGLLTISDIEHAQELGWKMVRLLGHCKSVLLVRVWCFCYFSS